jgi:adenylate cyclase
MAKERVQRRLAAIMAADVVGYSRLMEANEEETRARLIGLYAELFNPRIAADGGRIVKTMGDGILVEFPSVVDGVRNALSLQGAMRRRNTDIPEEIRIEFRVGVNLGDVIIEGDDIHGDGVNIAARLEGLCEPGEVYVSGEVHDQVAGKLEASFENLGEQTVKNIAKPVRIYRVSEEVKIAVKPEPQTPDTSSPNHDKPSIAVLPFDNMSNDPEQEYFSDGMAEDLITDISKISGVSVTARNSSFAFKGQSIDVMEIAKKLRVKHIVEGSVRKMGDRLRINAQLIDGTDGRHIWAERYDGNMAEIFEFQDDIRKQIVAALQVSLTPTDKVFAERKPTDSFEAYDLFLKGRSNFYHFTPEHLLEAIMCLEEAIEIDPKFGDAYGYLSFCHWYGWIDMWPGFDDTLDRAHELAEMGVALDGTSAIALTRLGWVQTWMRRYDQAVTNSEKAIALAPNNAEVYANYGDVLNYWGNPERGLEMVEKAFSLDTFHPPNWEMYAGISHLLMRQYDKAVTRFSRSIEQSPIYVHSHECLAWAYVELDRLDDARDSIKTVLEIKPNFTVQEAERIMPYRLDEDRNRALDALRKAGLPEG